MPWFLDLHPASLPENIINPDEWQVEYWKHGSWVLFNPPAQRYVAMLMWSYSQIRSTHIEIAVYSRHSSYIYVSIKLAQVQETPEMSNDRDLSFSLVIIGQFPPQMSALWEIL